MDTRIDWHLRHRFAVVNGVRLHWGECGAVESAASVPLVLVHGINDSHLTWKPVVPLLAAGRRVLMLDLPGCGLSDRPDASYELLWHSQLVTRWLKQLGLTRVDVVGHSFGGGVAQMLLLEPELEVRRLGLIASGGLGTRVALALRLAPLPGIVERFGQPFMALGTRLALRYYAGAAMSSEDVQRLSEMNAERGAARAFARTVADVISWRGQVRHFLQRAHEIQQMPPITLFWGDRDQVTPIEDALVFVKHVRGVRLVPFPGCGHYLHHESAGALSRELCAFLDAPWLAPAELRGPRPAATQTRAPDPDTSDSSWRGALVSVLLQLGTTTSPSPGVTRTQ